MLENTLKTTPDTTLESLMKLEEGMDFTLASHYKERIAFHMRMLNYYLQEQKNELAT